MVGLGKLDNISGLKLWLDASDSDTINDGQVKPNQNVYKFVDKKSGVVLTNSSGVNGPTYAVGALNGNNVIHFPYYSSTDTFTKTLSNNNFTQFSSSEKTLVVVYRPTTSVVTNTKYLFTVLGNGRPLTSGYFPSTYILNGSGTNPYMQYGEAPGVSPTSNIYEWNHQSYEYGTKTNIPIDLGSTQILISRTKNGVNKFNFFQDRGYNSKSLYYVGDTSISQGSGVIPPPPAKLVIGSLNNIGSKQAFAHPFEGYFCEMVYFDRYLTTVEVNSIEKYLKMKWIG